MHLAAATRVGSSGLTLLADDKRIIVGAGTDTSDIWLLEAFDPPATPWARWLRR